MANGYYELGVSLKKINKMILNAEQMDERRKDVIAEPMSRELLAAEYVALENEFWKLAKAYSELSQMVNEAKRKAS